MGRKRKPGFREVKMCSARVEADDFYEFERLVKLDGKKLQEAINIFIVSYTSGSVQFSGSQLVGSDHV